MIHSFATRVFPFKVSFVCRVMQKKQPYACTSSQECRVTVMVPLCSPCFYPLLFFSFFLLFRELHVVIKGRKAAEGGQTATASQQVYVHRLQRWDNMSVLVLRCTSHFSCMLTSNSPRTTRHAVEKMNSQPDVFDLVYRSCRRILADPPQVLLPIYRVVTRQRRALPPGNS